MNEIWNGLTECIDKSLVIEWLIHNSTILVGLFGDCLQECRYTDSKYQINFSLQQGGRLVPQITEKNPVKVKYNTSKKEMTVEFTFIAEKGHVKENGEVYYEQIC